MCASAIRWSNFHECIFATSIPTLVSQGWSQIDLRTSEVFERSWGLAKSESHRRLGHEEGKMTGLLGGVLTGTTDGLFGWQFQEEGKCPRGCGRVEGGGCVAEEEK